jgi:hypothetical protein
LLHVDPDGQTLPQPPQLRASVLLLTHDLTSGGGPEHIDSPALAHWQLEFTHVDPEGQTLPHDPQLLASVFRLTQTLALIIGGLAGHRMSVEVGH